MREARLFFASENEVESPVRLRFVAGSSPPSRGVVPSLLRTIVGQFHGDNSRVSVSTSTSSRLHKSCLTRAIDFVAYFVRRYGGRYVPPQPRGFLRLRHRQSRLVPPSHLKAQSPCVPRRTGDLAPFAQRLVCRRGPWRLPSALPSMQ